MTQNSHPGGEDIEEQFKLVRDDVARLARLIRQIGETKSTEARDAALAEANKLLERSQKKLDEGMTRAERTASSVEEYIHDKPVQSTLIALGIGILVGLLARR
ncbi:hypothetical protein RXV90_12960 [Rhodophyticola sp. MJ-SS7]|nr:hypothetical protein [Rhodophyticola sp. MJ-SS7]